MRLRTVVSALCAASLAAPVAAQQQPKTPQFGVSADMVSVTVSVTDKKGRTVEDLGPERFAVYENGIRQEIAMLERQALPLDLVLMIDTSGSMGFREQMSVSGKLTGARLYPEIPKAAKRLVEELRPIDRLMLVSFSDRVKVYEESPEVGVLTTNKAWAYSIIDALSPDQGTTRLFRSLYDVLHSWLPKPDPAHLRRTILVLISDGEDNDALVSEAQALEQIRKSGVLVYSIELRPQPARIGHEAWQREHDAHYFLEQVAKVSGGTNQVLRKSFEVSLACDVILRELKTQYRLGYQPESVAQDGSWRTIQVVVIGPGDLQVRHRQGYYAGMSRR